MSQQSFVQRNSNVLLTVAVGSAALALATSYYRMGAPRAPASRNCSEASKLQQLLSEYRRKLHVSNGKLVSIRDDMVKQMNQTLSGESESSIRMLPSMVDVLPTGSETGEYFALDMGGTNFRTVYVKLAEGGGKDEIEMDEFPFREEMHHSSAEELFHFMASKLVRFADRLNKRPKEGVTPSVGFCFSFPMDQTALNRGKLIKWTKGFTNRGAEGADVTLLLEQALEIEGMKAKVMSLVTDTVGTLVACRYRDQDTMLGVILGTGSNGAYIEQAHRIRNAPKALPEGSSMVINCEWGNFTCSALPFTDEDLAIDQESTNQGSQHFEKLTAGLYMGELARRIILRLATEGGLFGARIPEKLQTPGTLTTPQMGKIDHDTSDGLQSTCDILTDAFGLEAEQLAPESLQAVQEICHQVGWRAGRVKSVGIAAVMHQLSRDGSSAAPQRTVVGVDGGVFEHYKNYRAAMQEGLQDIMGCEAATHVDFQHVADGSSLGAAYLAAAAVAREGREQEAQG